MTVFISRLKNSRPPIIYEDGLMTRDFVFVKDVANINFEALRSGEGVFNVGTGKATSILAVYMDISRKLGSEIDPSFSYESRPGDIRNIFADNKKLKKAFPSISFTKLNDGITELLEWSSSLHSIDLFDKVESERKQFLSLNR
jgi:nucleoside-diphosphate-sugar epimerase